MSIPIRRTRPSKSMSIRTVLGCLVLCLASFYLGLTLGLHHSKCPSNEEEKSRPQRVVKAAKPTGPILPVSINKLLMGMALMERNEFAQEFDTGVPLDPTTSDNAKVLMLYSDQQALPYNNISNTAPIVTLSPQDATRHCNSLKIIMTDANKKKECLAIMGQWESHALHKWMRVPKNGEGPVNDHLPLQPVSRLTTNRGLKQQIPSEKANQEANAFLQSYLENLNAALEALRPVASKTARNNTIIVMVCNQGQSELLVNFVCSARARGLELRELLVFATDEETHAIAQGLGISVFYDKELFADIPKAAARRYADKTFSGMMLAKVYCVHMVNLLGFNLLFQDVDVVWYQNPLPYLQLNESWDMYFQDDGAHSPRYAPYSPNTGFYYAKYSDKTRDFFHAVLMSLNIIVLSGSHQNAMTVQLNHYTSLRGLRVKILGRDSGDFPGGFHFHRRKEFMQQLVQEKVQPYIFHMSWTNNKENKRRFFQQLGDWYVAEGCESGGVECCLAEPLVQCHYRDKPSKIPCKDSPPIDKNKPSWW